MLKRLVLFALLVALVSHPAFAQQPAPAAATTFPTLNPVATTTPQYDSAYFAWVEGRYPDALTRFEKMLMGPKAADVQDRIALVTGELYTTTDVSDDGNNVRWSRDGKMFAYIKATGGVRSIYLNTMTSTGPKASSAALPGYGLTFSPVKDEVAYLAIVESPELAAARAQAAENPGANRGGGRGAVSDVARLEAANSRIKVRDLTTGTDREIATTGLSVLGVGYGRDGTLYMQATPNDPSRVDIYSLNGDTPKQLTNAPTVKRFVGANATRVVYYEGGLKILTIATGETQQFTGPPQAALSMDGSTLAYVGAVGADTTLNVVILATGQSTVVRQGSWPIVAPTVSTDGKRIAYQMMPREDWEVYVVNADGTGETRITRDPQDDVLPAFLGADRLLVMKGEPRHRRSYIYDITTSKETRLFANNTIRTVSPEYEWTVSPDGSRILIVADRDGNTISPERGLYLTDISRKVTNAELLARVRAQAAAEKDLRARGQQMFAAIAAQVKPIVADVSSDRIYKYEKDLSEFDTRQVTRPGNLKAIEYFAAMLKSFGYEPDVTWFEPRPGLRGANVVATLKGTKFPNKIHVMSAHFDTVERAPGADDDGTGITALLEAARVMVGHPQPATIKFAFLTGEESGGLGAREFVRRAQANSANEQLVGVLNNDMGGWMEDGRYDDTIRYASDYLRDVEHAAAIEFTKLITYDARYYRGTDAGAFYDAFGPIVSGIGGYPILATPHYHETHDVVETISPHIIAEISKTSVASIMLMAQQSELPKPAS